MNELALFRVPRRPVALHAVVVIAGLLLAAGCDGGARSRGGGGVDGAAGAPPRAAPPVDVDAARITAASPAEWLTHGRGYDEQRYSPLARITAANVAQLGLAWWFDLETARGAEATPLVADGVLYATAPWSVVHALDARSGRLLWTYDPAVPREKAYDACCDVVNRGVALWGDRVYVGTLDGRLIALDRANGRPVWTQRTFDPATPRTITGAPRVVKGKVIIGHGGAEYGVRGYVSAYDARDGSLVWRFYTVPGDPASPPDGAASDRVLAEKARSTWSGEWWRYGGGGTVWDSMAYDAELDLLYFGVGNGSPWNHAIRSAGKGDNLFLSSIVAVRPDNGEYVWHYQTTPGDSWDYTATQHIVLAELEFDGKPRKVLMQAPKNGFFYVLDRTDGRLISAAPYVTVNWATGVDPQTGRPVERPEARYRNGPHLQMPSPFGGHNWHPMAFHPGNGLVYIPALDAPFVYAPDTAFRHRPGQWNLGADVLAAALPDDVAQRKAMRAMLRGALVAWDPVRQKEAWRVQHAGPWNGGVLATAGDLVFEGTSDARLVAWRASDGQQLWQAETQSGVVAPPVSFELDGEQYVAVMAGWGGALPLIAGALTANGGANRPRLLVYKLGGAVQLPAAPGAGGTGARPAPPADLPSAPALLARGKLLYQANCQFCHGDSAQGNGVLPDLRWSPMLQTDAAWKSAVLDGALAARGMAGFARFLDPAESAAIRTYVGAEARKELAAAAAAAVTDAKAVAAAAR